MLYALSPHLHRCTDQRHQNAKQRARWQWGHPHIPLIRRGYPHIKWNYPHIKWNYPHIQWNYPHLKRNYPHLIW